MSQTSYDYTRPCWDQIGATIAGRHVFDMTDGWDGVPPTGVDHVVVVTHRPAPDGWDPDAPSHFVDGIEAAVAAAQELAGDRIVEVAAGDVGGQALAAGLVDEVRMDVAPVVLGSGKRFFGSVDGQHLLEDPDVACACVAERVSAEASGSLRPAPANAAVGRGPWFRKFTITKWRAPSTSSRQKRSASSHRVFGVCVSKSRALPRSRAGRSFIALDPT